MNWICKEWISFYRLMSQQTLRFEWLFRNISFQRYLILEAYTGSYQCIWIWFSVSEKNLNFFSGQVAAAADVLNKGERFVSRYIANAIYCIIWKYRDIAIFRKYRDILTIFSVHDIGQFWPFMDLHGQFLLLNLVVYWHVSFNWLVSAFTFLSSCDECQPLLNYWFLSKRRAACHQDWKFDLIRRVNKKEQLWNIIIYLFVLRINAQTNSCFIEFLSCLGH